MTKVGNSFCFLFIFVRKEKSEKSLAQSGEVLVQAPVPTKEEKRRKKAEKAAKEKKKKKKS